MSDEIILNNDFIGNNKSNNIVNMQITQYENLLIKWGGVHNIFSRKFSPKNVRLSIYDCCLGLDLVPRSPLFFDVGAGGGLPGVVCALLRPQSEVVLIETNRKKCSFLRLVKSQLNLGNLEILNSRVEHCKPVSNIISRAAFSPEKISLLSDFCAPGGIVSLWISAATKPNFEAKAQELGLAVLQCEEYQNPMQNKRCILRLKKSL